MYTDAAPPGPAHHKCYDAEALERHTTVQDFVSFVSFLFFKITLQ